MNDEWIKQNEIKLLKRGVLALFPPNFRICSTRLFPIDPSSLSSLPFTVSCVFWAFDEACLELNRDTYAVTFMLRIARHDSCTANPILQFPYGNLHKLLLNCHSRSFKSPTAILKTPILFRFLVTATKRRKARDVCDVSGHSNGVGLKIN